MAAVTELANNVGTSAACQALCMPRASYYRDRRKISSPAVTASRPSPARALHPVEREAVLSRLLLCSALPLLAISFAFGGVEPMELLKATGSTILVLASICAIGLWCSAIFRRSVHSTAACYGIVLVLSVVTAVAFGILVSHWQSSEYLARGEGPPAYIQAPLFLNPLYPLLSLLDTGELGKFSYPVSSWLLFTALGCLAAAFAMRSIQRSGEQL